MFDKLNSQRLLLKNEMQIIYPHAEFGLTYIFKREFVELSVAYKMSSYILEKYKPVISGQSKT